MSKMSQMARGRILSGGQPSSPARQRMLLKPSAMQSTLANSIADKLSKEKKEKRHAQGNNEGEAKEDVSPLARLT